MWYHKTPPNAEIVDPGPFCEVDFSQNSFANFPMGFSTASTFTITGSEKRCVFVTPL